MRLPLLKPLLFVSLAVGTASVTAGSAAPAGAWYKGDTHVHDDHSSDGSLARQTFNDQAPGNVSIADQISEGVRLGLDWMPLTDHRTYDQHYDPLWESSSLLLIPGEEANGSPHCTVQGAVDTIVQGADREGFAHLQTSIWDAHSQGANWSIAHPDDGELNSDGTPNVMASAVGYDTMETWNRGSDVEMELDYAESRWNRGLRFGVVGGSDDHFRELWAIAGPGMPTTQVFAPTLIERGIVQGLQGGRTTLHLLPTDPVVTLEADFDGDGVFEAISGDEVTAASGTAGTLRVHVTNGVGTTVIVYKSPGRSAGAFATFTPQGLDNTFTVAVKAGEAPSWYRVEVRGPGQIASVNTNAIKALGKDPGSLLPYVGTVVQDSSNALRAQCSPLFVAPGPVEGAGEKRIPDDLGGDDGAVTALGDAGLFSGFPDVAAPGEAVHLVAELHEAGATRIRYRRIELDGTQGPAILLSGASASGRFPRIAAHGRDVWVVWQDERAGQVPRRPAIYLRHSADGGNLWQPEQLVRSLDGRAEHPAIALTASGLPLVAWQEISAGNPFDVMAQVVGQDRTPVNLSRAGKTITAASAFDTRSARYPASVWPAVAVSPAGLMAVSWQDDRTDPDPLWTGALSTGNGTNPDNWQIQTVTRAANAKDWSSPVAVGADDRADRHPAVTFAQDNTLVLAWDSKPLSAAGVNLSIASALSRDGGKTFSKPLTVAASSVGMGQYPRLGRTAEGAAHLVWYDNRSADWRWRVMAVTVGADGQWGEASTLMSRGINAWPAYDNGVLAFTSTRNAQRLQRDRTQQIMLLPAQITTPSIPTTPTTPTTPVIPVTPVTPTTPVTPANPSAVVGDKTDSAQGRFGGGAFGALWLLVGAILRRRSLAVRVSLKD